MGLCRLPSQAVRLPGARHGQGSFIWANAVMGLQTHSLTPQDECDVSHPARACAGLQDQPATAAGAEAGQGMPPGCARGSAARYDALQAASTSVKMPCSPTRQPPCTLQISRLCQRTDFCAGAGLWPLRGHKPIRIEELDTGTDWDSPNPEVYCRSLQPLHGAQPPEHPRQLFS